jgi:hypothetical protein
LFGYRRIRSRIRTAYGTSGSGSRSRRPKNIRIRKHCIRKYFGSRCQEEALLSMENCSYALYGIECNVIRRVISERLDPEFLTEMSDPDLSHKEDLFDLDP